MKYSLILPLAAILSACSSVATSTSQTTSLSMTPSVSKALPEQIIYRMNGDYANLVPVTMDNNMEEVISYPDPVDIKSSQAPIALGDGWFLDRRGISMNTAFTDYTYEAYSALSKVPTRAEIKSHIIDRHGIKEIKRCGRRRLTVEQAKQLVKDGFPGCNNVMAEINL